MLRVAQKTANFPMLTGNVESTRNTWPKFPSFEIIEKGGLRIEVYGLTTPAAPIWHEKLGNDLVFLGILQSAKEITQILREDSGLISLLRCCTAAQIKSSVRKKTCMLASPTPTLGAGWSIMYLELI